MWREGAGGRGYNGVVVTSVTVAVFLHEQHADADLPILYFSCQFLLRVLLRRYGDRQYLWGFSGSCSSEDCISRSRAG